VNVFQVGPRCIQLTTGDRLNWKEEGLLQGEDIA
jgi:hypothetical protein